MLHLPGRPGPRDRRPLFEPDQLEDVRRLLQTAASQGKPVLLPSDVVVAREGQRGRRGRTVPTTGSRPAGAALDVGPETAKAFAAAVADARTVFWNGPMGVFELAPFAAGTRAVAEAVPPPPATPWSAGRLAAALAELGLADRVDHLSTGERASLELLEGKTLPGVAAPVRLKEGRRGSPPADRRQLEDAQDHLEGIQLTRSWPGR